MDFHEPIRGRLDHPLRVLIIRVGAMGDILHALPAVTALRNSMPGCYLGWAVEPKWQPLLQAEGVGSVVDKVHPVFARDWKEKPVSLRTLRQILNLRREMKAEQYDLCVDLQGSIRSAVIGRMASAERFVGSSRPREQQARALYSECVSVQAKHVVAQACELLSGALRDGWALGAMPITLPVDAAAERWADSMAMDRFVLLAPTAGWGAKEWPRKKFGDLASALMEQGLRVLVNSGAGASDAAQQVIERSGAQAIQCGLAELIALTRRATLVVGGDTGPVQLAAALGRPVVALFGPTDPERTGPQMFHSSKPAQNVTVIRSPHSMVDHRRHAATEAGLAQITVEDVVAAALRQLGMT